MLKQLALVHVLACVALSSVTPAAARDYIRYDAEQQAIAVDLYAYELGNYIEIDFDADHLTAGVLDQHFPEVTFLGLRRVTMFEDSTRVLFGWADGSLWDAQPAQSFSTCATTLVDDTPAAQAFCYFAPEWDPPAGKTVVYVRPGSETGSVPVTPEMAANVFVRLNEIEWQPLSDSPFLMAPLAAQVAVSPPVFSRSHGPRSLLVRVTLPSPYTVADLDLPTVGVSAVSLVAIESIDVLRVELSRKLAVAGSSGNTLIARFERDELINQLIPPEAEIYAVGRLRDGTPIRGAVKLKVTE